LLESARFLNELRQVGAKAQLADLSARTDHVQWNYNLSRLIRNMAAITMGAKALSIHGSLESRVDKDAIRTIAMAWENIAKLEEGVQKNYALLNSAILYELSGYQANAVCLSRLLEDSLQDSEAVSLEKLASTFLQRFFIKTRILADTCVLHLEESTRRTELDVKQLVLEMTCESLLKISEYFLGGNERSMKAGRELLEYTAKVFDSLGMIQEGNIANGLLSLLAVMMERSTWTLLKKYSDSTGRWSRYLKLLARGTGKRIPDSVSISEMWPSQLEAIRGGLLDSDSSKIVRMPTSSGKTRTAELAIAYTLISIPESRCIYVAPYRALVSEIEESFLRIFSDLGFSVASIIGTYEYDDFEQFLVEDSDLLIMTPEKLDLLLRARPDFLENVRLLVLDEVQIVHDESRGIKFEILMTRIRKRLPRARFLLLSAVISRDLLDSLSDWLGSSRDKDILESDWRPSLQKLGLFTWRNNVGRIDYITEDEKEEEFVPGIIAQTTYEHINPTTKRTNRPKFPTKSKSDISAELAIKLSENGPVLVFCSQKRYVNSIAKALRKRLEYNRLCDIPPPTPLSEIDDTRSLRMALEWLGPNHIATQMLKRGVAIHHGDIPHAVRNAIELDFRKKRFNILIATNTLAQGVNLPIRTVIVHSCWRQTGDGRRVRIPARDYWNIAGRAGRPGQETIGSIIHVALSPRDRSDFRYYLERRQNIETSNSALFDLLQRLVQDRISLENAALKLDPEVLALLVEESSPFQETEFSRDFLEHTLAAVQATESKVDIEPLQKAFAQQAKKIIEKLPDPTYLFVYSSTGLTSNSCEIIRKFVKSEEIIFRKLLTERVLEDQDVLISTFLSALVHLDEMQTYIDSSVPIRQLLKEWLLGRRVDEIKNNLDSQAPSIEVLAKFIERFFGFRLPWGISALIKIACKELEIDKDSLPPMVCWLPAMVKYGVPSPIAAWALMSGIHYRQLAIRIAEKYSKEKGEENFRSFQDWKRKLNLMNFAEEMDLDSDIIDDIIPAFMIAPITGFVRDHASVEEILPHRTQIKAIYYVDPDGTTARHAAAGMSVELKREYANQFDRNAVKVFLNGKPLGYLEKELSQLAAPDMDSGLSLSAEIVDTIPTDPPIIHILISKTSEFRISREFQR